MSETQMEPMKDAAKNRRECSRKRSMAIILALGSAATLILSLAGTMFGAIAAWGDAMPHPTRSITFGIWYQLIVVLVPTAITVIASLIFRSQVKVARSLSYVPPVAEQVAALPAEEILVRGSDLPAATPAELLRPAREGTETAAEVLLRPQAAREHSASGCSMEVPR